MIELREVQLAYDTKVIVDAASLSIADGELICLLGASGSGKSTLLRAIAGLMPVSSGVVLIDEKDVTALPPEQRNIGMVFQSYALFPQMTVLENAAFGLRAKKVTKQEAHRRAGEVLAAASMREHLSSTPAQLSGGQQQRVAIARALATRPSVLLMDEPLSNLDVKLRASLRDEIVHLHRSFGMTTVYVTHDQEEAMAIADRIAVLRDGAIVEVGTPDRLYHHPQTQYVATFLGDCNALGAEALAAFGVAVSEAAWVGVRPELVRIDDAVRPDEHSAVGTVVSSTMLGPLTRLVVDVAGSRIDVLTLSGQSAVPPEGQPIRIGFSAGDVLKVRT